MRRPAHEKRRGDKDHECAGLEPSGQELRAAPPANSAPLQSAKPGNDGDGNDFQLLRPGENRKKMAAVFADNERDGCGSAASGEPVAPADDEAGVLAQSAARKIVLSAAAGNRGAKLGHGRRAAKGVEAANDPDA